MKADALPDSGDSLNRRIVRGASWMVGLRFADHFVGFLSTIVLARLLVPADFGLVAVAMAMIAAVAVFSEFGFELALIQNQKADRSHYDTAWTLGLLRGIVETAIILLAAEPLAAFFENPRLENVILVLAAIPLLSALSNIGTVAFRKELTFNKEFIFRIVPRIAGVIATITLAIAWRNHWALVTGMLAGRALGVIMSYVMQSYRPRLSLAAWREILNFSKWIVAAGIPTFINRRASTFVVAKVLDAAAVGTFSIASQIAGLASAELIAPIKQALFPGYAKLAHDIPQLRVAFIDTYGFLVLVALPVAVGLGLTAEYYVPLLLGPNWMEAIALIEILVISSSLRSLVSHIRPLYLAMNRPSLGAYAALGRAIVFVPALIIGITQYGLVGAAVAQMIGNIVVFIASVYLAYRLVRVRPADLLDASWRSLVACAAMVLALMVLKQFPPISSTDLVGLLSLLLSAILAGAATYIGTVLGLWLLCGKPARSAESHLLTYIMRVLGKRQPRVT